MRLIDADVLKELIDGGSDIDFSELPETKRALLEMIDYQDTIDAEPVRHGMWIHDGYDFRGGCDWIHCSVCGKSGINVPADLTNFCSNCGARMDEVQT